MLPMRIPYALFSVLFATSLSAQLVINEVDYDQPSTDVSEFIEIKNVGTVDFPLSSLAVVLVNGANGNVAIYQTITSTSWPVLGPGEYFVICGNEANTPNCDHVGPAATNLIQNGVPDAIALLNVTTEELMDVLAYGGPIVGYTEGTPATTLDVNVVDGRSISRWPDGADSNDNDADFQLACSTPGAPNLVDPIECDVPSTITEAAVPASFSVLMDAGRDQLSMTWGGDSNGPVTFEVFNIAGSKVAEHKAGTGRGLTWDLSLRELHGQLLLVRATSGTRQLVRRVVVP
jgi:hypothetical protein